MKENIFDIYELPDGHEERFLQKLAKQQSHKRGNRPLRRFFYVSCAAAASVVLFFGIAQNQANPLEKASLAAYQSEQYYLPLIEQNIQNIKKMENKKAMQDALHQLDKMNKNYQHIRQEIIKNGENKQLLAAMMTNFDTQLDFSNEIIAMIQ